VWLCGIAINTPHAMLDKLGCQRRALLAKMAL
jgi:hypothetical protein